MPIPPRSPLAGARPVAPVKKPASSPVAVKNAAEWNKPGGGYDKFKTGDAAREKAMPIGTILPKHMASPMSFAKGGTVKKTGLALVHKGEKVTPAKGKNAKLVEAAGHEIKVNPPKILKKTAKKSGAKKAAKQKVAIMLSKARAAGANIPQK